MLLSIYIHIYIYIYAHIYIYIYAAVVWDWEDYISEANRQLDDMQVYEEVEVDPSVDLGNTINSRLNELREEDPGLEEVTDYLKVKDSKLGSLIHAVKYIYTHIYIYIYALSINKKKTETMVISKKNNAPKCSISISNTTLNQVNKFKYLGTIITPDGRCDTEIKSRITQSKQTFTKMKSILTNKKLAFQVRERVIQCYILPVLMYGCEAWTINKDMEKRIDALEMWLHRRLMKIPWTEKRANESILNELGKKLTLKSKIRKQQANFFGHAMRRQGLENLITTARVLGKRSRGRPREKILDGVRKWAGEERTVDLITKTQDRELWRNMVSNAFRQGT